MSQSQAPITVPGSTHTQEEEVMQGMYTRERKPWGPSENSTCYSPPWHPMIYPSHMRIMFTPSQDNPKLHIYSINLMSKILSKSQLKVQNLIL